MLKTDEYGFQYLDELPQSARQIKTVWPFVTLDPEAWNYYHLNVGMKYAIQAKENNRYYLGEITEHSRDFMLLKYAETGQLFIFKDDNIE